MAATNPNSDEAKESFRKAKASVDAAKAKAEAESNASKSEIKKASALTQDSGIAVAKALCDTEFAAAKAEIKRISTLQQRRVAATPSRFDELSSISRNIRTEVIKKITASF